MVWVFFVVGAAVVFAIAAAFVGSESFRLGHEPRSAVFDLDEAVAFVGDVLPDSTTGRLSYDELRLLISFELDHLGSKGLSMRGDDDVVVADGPPITVADDDAVAVVLGRVSEDGLEVADEDVFEVIAGLLAYLAEIGAIGTSVPEPPDPENS